MEITETTRFTPLTHGERETLDKAYRGRILRLMATRPELDAYETERLAYRYAVRHVRTQRKIRKAAAY